MARVATHIPRDMVTVPVTVTARVVVVVVVVVVADRADPGLRRAVDRTMGAAVRAMAVEARATVVAAATKVMGMTDAAVAGVGVDAGAGAEGVGLADLAVVPDPDLVLVLEPRHRVPTAIPGCLANREARWVMDLCRRRVTDRIAAIVEIARSGVEIVEIVADTLIVGRHRTADRIEATMEVGPIVRPSAENVVTASNGRSALNTRVGRIDRRTVATVRSDRTAVIEGTVGNRVTNLGGNPNPLASVLRTPR